MLTKTRFGTIIQISIYSLIPNHLFRKHRTLSDCPRKHPKIWDHRVFCHIINLFNEKYVQIEQKIIYI